MRENQTGKDQTKAERQTDGERDRQRHKHTDRQTRRLTSRGGHAGADTYKHKRTEIQTDR